MRNTYDESQFNKMTDENYVRRAQIPIRENRFHYLVELYSPNENGDYILFHHPGHFIIYEKTTGNCVYDAKYVVFRSHSDDSSEQDPIRAVITEIKCSQDNTQHYASIKDDFSFFCELILQVL